MKKQLEQVAEFTATFRHTLSEEPTIGTPAEALLRHNLMAEENQEYLDAVKEDNLVEVADALGDQLYILCGTILKHGMQYIIEDVFSEIHRSNMSKLGVDGKPIYREDGKVLKGENYLKPDLKQFIDEK